MGVLLMTQQEADAIVAATPPDVTLAWAKHPDPRFVGLVGSPACPLLGADNSCRVYDVRPLNCRRFMCLREPGEILEPGGPFGCANAARRMGDRETRRFITLTTRRALARWGYAHGWHDDTTRS